MSRHNIVGSEATDQHRLVAFSHAHGSLRMLPRPRPSPSHLLAFLAGVAAVLTAALLIGRA